MLLRTRAVHVGLMPPRSVRGAPGTTYTSDASSVVWGPFRPNLGS